MIEQRFRRKPRVVSIPLFDPKRAHAPLQKALEEAAVSVLRSGRYILGPEVEAFEQSLSDRLEGRPVVGVSSGTDALVLALRALEIGPGDEVLTTPYTFVATVDAILRVGATPRFVDIDPTSLMPTAEALTAATSAATRAVIIVHLFGAAFDCSELEELRSRGIAVLEDAAQAFGARLGDREVGTMGDVGAFSFFPTKNLGGYGDGGAVVLDSQERADYVRALRAHGRGARSYYSSHIGYNARLDAMQAALLRVKLAHVDAANSTRRDLAGNYHALIQADERLRELVVLTPDPESLPGHVFHQYVLRVKPGFRDVAVAHLKESKIGVGIYYPTGVHQQPLVKGHVDAELQFPETEAACLSTFAIPMFPGLTGKEQEEVIFRLCEAAEQYMRASGQG